MDRPTGNTEPKIVFKGENDKKISVMRRRDCDCTALRQELMKLQCELAVLKHNMKKNNCHSKASCKCQKTTYRYEEEEDEEEEEENKSSKKCNCVKEKVLPKKCDCCVEKNKKHNSSEKEPCCVDSCDCGETNSSCPVTLSSASYSASFKADSGPISVAPDTGIDFPNESVITGGGIIRLSSYLFKLVNPGLYRITYNVTLTGSGGVILKLNGVALPYTMRSGTAAGPLSGSFQVSVNTANSTIGLYNQSTTTAINIGGLGGQATVMNFDIEQLSQF
jgi:hypothetical protein